jgi:uncharacterized protein YjbI with pentapeptide repeats
VLEALTAFVREGTKVKTTTPWSLLPKDIQAALTVIGRRSAYVNDLIDLSDANLPSADLFGANLAHADLTHAYLPGANLSGANLSGAYLRDANLNADLSGDNLSRAILTLANLLNANLTAANLTGAHLNRANLTGAILDGQKQLDEACGSDALLPTGLTLKPCSPSAK